MRKAGALLLLSLLAVPGSVWPGGALAQAGGPQDSARCQQQCGAVLPRRIDNTRDVQICLFRCEALERLQPPAVAARGAPAVPSAAPNTAARPPTAAERRQQAAAAARQPPAAPAVPPAPAVAVPPAPEAGRFGAISLAPAPATQFGIVLGQPDRAAAQRLADQQCSGRTGVPCRVALEVRDRCGAVAQGLLAKGMFMTSDPGTYTVMAAAAGSGATQAAAEAEAMAGCRQRYRGVCKVAASRCEG